MILQNLRRIHEQLAAAQFWRKIYIVIFFCLLLAPLLFAIAGEPRTFRQDIRENRAMSQWAQINWRKASTLPQQLDEYFNDNLGLRRLFIAGQMRLFEWVLHSPMRYGIRGQHGLFSSLLADQHLQRRGHFRERLYNLRALFYGRQTWFLEHDSQYLLIIPPDKETVLAESLAWWFPAQQKRNSFLDAAKKIFVQTGINFLSFDDVFLQSANPEKFFYEKKDLFHWSQTGFAHASAATLDSIRKLFPDRKFDVYPRAVIYKGDLHAPPYGREKADLYFYEPAENYFSITPFETGEKDFELGEWYAEGVKIENAMPGALGTAVIAVDSFFDLYPLTFENGIQIPLLPPWGCNFAKIYSFDRADFSFETMKRIGSLHPDLVVDAHCERGMGFGDIRETHISAMLWGEKCLGTLRCVLEPASRDFTLAGNAKSERKKIGQEDNLVFIAQDSFSIVFPPFRLDKEGYGVLAARVASSSGVMPVCQYRSKGGEWLNAEKPWYAPQRDPDIVYAQIFASPNAEIEARLVFPAGAAQYRILPMSFLNS